MNTISLKDIKNELKNKDAKELAEICLKLVKNNQENKELVYFFLFENKDKDSFLNKAKLDISAMYFGISTNFYITKKTLRKILRITNRFLKFSEEHDFKIELLLHFIQEAIHHKIDFNSHPVITNIMANQVSKIRKYIPKLHADLQFDYNHRLTTMLEQVGYKVIN